MNGAREIDSNDLSNFLADDGRRAHDKISLFDTRRRKPRTPGKELSYYIEGSLGLALPTHYIIFVFVTTFGFLCISLSSKKRVKKLRFKNSTVIGNIVI